MDICGSLGGYMSDSHCIIPFGDYQGISIQLSIPESELYKYEDPSDFYLALQDALSDARENAVNISVESIEAGDNL